MPKKILAGLLFCVLALPLSAQNLWTSKIDTFGNFVKQTENPNTDGIVSRFTPASDISVTRVQLQVAGGTSCTALPGIEVTDSTTSFTILIPNSTLKNGYYGPVSADSGPIELPFPKNAPLLVKATPGNSGCNPYEINITVQYSIAGN
jgi:hypothetical protein